MAQSNHFIGLYDGYDGWFGNEDGLGVGDMIRMDEEAQPSSVAKKKPKRKIRKDNVVITGIDCYEDEGPYSIRTHIVDNVLKDQNSSETNTFENLIPNDLKEIDADRYLNYHLEMKYHENQQEKGDSKSALFEEPAPVETITPIVKTPKQKKVKRNNALVEGLKKKGMMKNETGDTSLASSVSSCSTPCSSDSSQDFVTANTSGEDSFHSAGSAASPVKKTNRRKSTSKRLNISKFNELHIDFPRKATVSQAPVAPVAPKREEKFKPYVPEIINHNFVYDHNDFPLISK